MTTRMMKHLLFCMVVSSTLQVGAAALRVCNGLASNCNQRVNELMFATVHNAMSSLRDGFLGYNNLLPLEDALKAGFRGLLLDSCDCNDGDVDFCHSICVVGRRDAGTVFNSIVTFLTANPTDVVIIELEINDNSLDRLWASTTSAFRALLYTHPGVNVAWPTLNDLISKGKRIIVFQHNGPDCDQNGKCPAGVHK